MSARFQTVDDLKAKVLRYFGAPAICVELTAEQVQDAYEDAKRWFIDRTGGVPKLMFIPIAAGQTEFDLPAEVEDVVEVAFPDTSLFQIAAPEVFSTSVPVTYLGLGGAGGFVRGYSAHNPGGASGSSFDGENPAGQGDRDLWPNSGLLQVLQHLETSRRLLSAGEDWDYDQHSHKLRLFPQAGTALSGMLVVEFLSNEWDIACLSAAESDILYRRMRIEVMWRLGEIRSKFDAFPVPGGERSLNGADLLSRAEIQEGELNEYVLNRFKPGFFFAE